MTDSKPRQILAITLAASAAILIQPFLMAVGSFLQLVFLDGSKNFGEIFAVIKFQTIEIFNFIVTVSGVFVFFLGVPCFIILRRFQRLSELTLGFTGLLTSAIVVLMMAWLLSGKTFSLGDGEYVRIIDCDNCFDGIKSIFGIIEYVMHWMLGSLVFLNVYKRLVSRLG